LLQQARNAFDVLRDHPEARDAHDGLRILAATLGVTIVVPKRTKTAPKLGAVPLAEAPVAVDYAAVLKQVDTLVMEAITLVRSGRLPDRRDWIFQNAVELFRDGMALLHRTLCPPVRAVKKVPVALPATTPKLAG